MRLWFLKDFSQFVRVSPDLLGEYLEFLHHGRDGPVFLRKEGPCLLINVDLHSFRILHASGSSRSKFLTSISSPRALDSTNFPFIAVTTDPSSVVWASETSETR